MPNLPIDVPEFCGNGHDLSKYGSMVKSNQYGGLKISCSECKRKYNLVFRYSISVEQYESMLTEQNNSCKICYGEFGSGDKSPCIDHDHRCCHGEVKGMRSCGDCVRGIICKRCNRLLGMVDDNMELLLNAVDYLRGE